MVVKAVHVLENNRSLFWCLVSGITGILRSPSVFACIMAIIANSLAVSADAKKSHTVKPQEISNHSLSPLKFQGFNSSLLLSQSS